MYLEINKYPSVPNMINYQGQYCSMDSPGKSASSLKDFNSHPIQNFDYQFNSWGFRDEDFEQHLSNKVNICLGDSITLNYGGPAEHSWPGQLKKNFDIPTLNFGMAAVGNDAILKVYKSIIDLFDVQNTFVMYSFFHRRLVNGRFEQDACSNNEENFEYFKAHRLAGVIECALPGWSYTEEEKQFLLEQDLYFLDKPLYFSDYQGIDRKLIDKQAYKSFRGTTWPTLKQFIQGAEPHTDMYTKEFGGFVSDKNRDGYHINYNANSIYADYFYNQWKIKNESQNITQT
tara:strand:+ start:679 stop:1539 length:861 start_codon:yes stop_codon:yes gene_type:complete